MNALVSTCLRPSKRNVVMDEDMEGTLTAVIMTNQHNFGSDQEAEEIVSMPNANQEAPPSPPNNTTGKTLVQSPSRPRTFWLSDLACSKKDAKIPQLYSPLSKKYKGSKATSSSMPTMPDLTCHKSRWEFQSTLAGDHQQRPDILDLSHTRINPMALQYGLTPRIAERITEFRFNRDLIGIHDLPSFLDMIKTLLPNLRHLFLKVNNEQDTEDHVDEDCDETEVFSSDGVVRNGAQDEESTGSNESAANKQRESEKIERLYILYRLPHLLYIDAKEVTRTERNLACPNSVGYQVKDYDWIKHKNPLSNNQNSENLESSIRYHSAEGEKRHAADCDGKRDVGFEVPLNSTDGRSRMVDSSPKITTPRKAIDPKRNLSPPSPASTSMSTYVTDLKPLHLFSDSNAHSPRTILRMFPRTGKSIATKSKISNNDLDYKKTQERNLTNGSRDQSDSEKNFKAENEHRLISSPPEHTQEKPPQQPKHNLDSFLQKGNARNTLHPKTPLAHSEATDVAIAGTGQLISSLSLKIDSSDSEKENALKSQSNKNAGYQRKKNDKFPLVGSTVKVKLKKRNSRPPKCPSPPPPPPASLKTSTTFTKMADRNKVKIKRILSSASLMDDIDDDDISLSDSEER